MPNAERPMVTYAESGVDIAAGEEAVERIRGLVSATHGPEVLEGIGGFGSLFAPDLSKTPQPVLVSGTDSVGTKLKVAFLAAKHDTVGVDCVAMSVNDVLCQGARPLFFLDYIGIGVLAPGVAEDLVRGVAEGCRQAQCALVGGEMAELPGIYSEGEYDLVGFAVGVVDRSTIVNGRSVKPGQALIGLASSGLHSNGYSLARKVVLEIAGLGVGDPLPGCGRTVGEEMLEPTRLYTKPVMALLDAMPVHGLAHITGGGLTGNVPRCLPDGVDARIEIGSWPVPPIFDFIARTGPVAEAEMFHVFNMGVGLAAVVDADRADQAVAVAGEAGVQAFRIGEVVAADGPARVQLEGTVWGR